MEFQNAHAPSTAKYPCVFGKLSDPKVTWFGFLSSPHTLELLEVYKLLCINSTEGIYWLQFLGLQICIFSLLKTIM